MSNDDGDGLAFLLPVVVLAYILAPASWINGLWYGVEYHVSINHVHTADKPKDCDFMHAPLGDKGCRYKAYVHAYDAAGVLVGGDGAPRYGHDTKTGRPIISFDDGKTWQWSLGTTSLIQK